MDGAHRGSLSSLSSGSCRERVSASSTITIPLYSRYSCLPVCDFILLGAIACVNTFISAKHLPDVKKKQTKKTHCWIRIWERMDTRTHTCTRTHTRESILSEIHRLKDMMLDPLDALETVVKVNVNGRIKGFFFFFTSPSSLPLN